VIVIAGVATLAFARPGTKPDRGASPQTFEVSGSVEPVYPLVDAVLPVTVINPNGFAILVTELTITASDASADCAADNLMIAPVSVPFSVDRKGTTTVNTAIRLVDDAANDCQGATFPLAYQGTAIKH
jgi:hypothetical protein